MAATDRWAGAGAVAGAAGAHGALSRRLALAACALVGATGVAAQSAEDAASPAPAAALPGAADWTVDGSWLSYTESDERVAVDKTIVDLSRVREANSVSVNLVHDTMSGASPSGATRDASGQVTYTGASGGPGFNASDGSGDGSLVPFEDTRVQAGVAVENELSRALSLSYGGAVSQESDYDSFGANVGLARSSDDKATTLEAGVAATFDSIYRSGSEDTPAPLGDASRVNPFEKGERNTVDALVGVTQVLNKRTLAQLNLGFGFSSGYHSDPYKVISAVDGEGRPVANLHDSRPDSRLRSSLYGKLVHRVAGLEHTVHLSYRLYGDDWGILSNTVDLRYRIGIGERAFVEPHLRLYRQGAADFYASTLAVDARLDPVLPEDGYASADYRLDAMSSTTLGMKYGIALNRSTDVRLRAAYLNQSFDSAQYDTLSAVILQGSLRYRF